MKMKKCEHNFSIDMSLPCIKCKQKAAADQIKQEHHPAKRREKKLNNNPPSSTLLKKQKQNDGDAVITSGDPIPPELRRVLRLSTQAKTGKAKELADQRALKPPGRHASAKDRAVSNVPGHPTSTTNQASVEQLLEDKKYKKDALRVHFKGQLDDENRTTGCTIFGAHIQRSSWTTDQKAINRALGEELKKNPAFIAAPHKNGTHGAEIAHVRRQAAGGFTDPLGAYSASVHTNIEDMAREEGMEDLRKRLGNENVRLKSTVYVHDGKVWAGTMKARREKIYIKNNETGEFEKKVDHLQDGRRGNIDKDEAQALKSRIMSLDSSSPNVRLHQETTPKGITPTSSVQLQESFRPKKNDSTRSPYFTGIRSSDGKVYSGSDANQYIREINVKTAEPHMILLKKPKKKK